MTGTNQTPSTLHPVSEAFARTAARASNPELAAAGHDVHVFTTSVDGPSDSDVPLTALFGDEHKVKLFDPDVAAAKANRARIVESMQTLRVLKEPTADRRILLIGANAWPLPFPIVKSGDRWRFATISSASSASNRFWRMNTQICKCCPCANRAMTGASWRRSRG